MRLVSFRRGNEIRLGAELDNGIVDLTETHAALLGERGVPEADAVVQAEDAVPPDIVAFLERGEAALQAARQTLEFAAGNPQLALPASDVELLPPVPRPPKIVCAARNYGEHAAEAGVDILEFPNLFVRFATSLVAHGAPILVPKASPQADWEGELAVIIGRHGRHISKDDALDHVAGYSIFNDVSIRDWQFRVPQFVAGKNFDASGPFGPALVTKDEVPDPQALHLELRLNGEVMQSSTTAHMIFSVAALIEHVSSFATLEPGDVIATGTPSGVGFVRKPPRFLEPGDTVQVEIEQVGLLENPVAAEAG
jgi:2-keto-4-pentenoate hydratase/2-oxohepta-3-ene-1,7-dioic acid hydratase in catechol pathway